MEPEKMEAGLILTKPLLVTEKSDANNSGREGKGEVTSSDSSVTSCAVLSTLVAVCGSFCYGCTMAYSSPAEAGIMKDLGLSTADYSIFGSVLTIGGVIGASFSGRIVADIGQRHTMWISEVFCILGWLAIVFAKDAWSLYAGRLSLGIGIGLITYVVPLYVAEIAPKNLRGTFAAATQFTTVVSFSTIYFTGNLITWRWLAVVGAIPFVVQFIGLFFIPESPRWLAKSGKEKEFKDAIQRLRGKNTDVSEEIAEIRETMLALKQQAPGRFSDLLQRRYLNALIVGIGLMLLQQLGGCSAMSFYSNSIFEKANASSSIGTTAIAIIQIPVGFASVYLMDLSGRRPLLMVSASGMSLCSLLVGLGFVFQELQCWTQLTPILASIGIMGYPAMFSLGMAGIPWIIMSEIFPVKVKASAGSLVALVSWSGSWIVTYTFNFLMEWSYPGTFFIFSAVCASTVVFAWKLVPETKGRTLEEIQESFAHFGETEICK
ncbi:hypothetical protein Tsubulata_039992 [Turnera subulata]|uniref:Major facilitator superfamily (MFS) profile domain-containing protein n=1 Tax=Turnera subulata TaxID=218843 RepID=A0A9Q0JBC7_9ROSI|nr:hypothetical protein Tsubulata_039992 [Turnera subulata]